MPYVVSPRAQADLGEIWDHTLSRWGSTQAERYLRQIQAALVLLSQNPRLGRSASAIRRGYRKHPRGAHVIFYREIAAGIDVVRILHRRMDVPSLSQPNHRKALRRARRAGGERAWRVCLRARAGSAIQGE